MTPGKPNPPAVYKLGRIAFSIENGLPPFLGNLEILLPRCTDADESEIHHVSTNDLRELQNRIFALHEGCLWLDAGCLITPNGKRVLIVGRSGAGKSTTTMALALAYDWKVIAEDILLIDFNKDELITFGAPFSLKPGTKELLRDSIGKVPDPIVMVEWSPLGKMSAPSGASAFFDVCFVFTRTYQESNFRVTELSAGEYYRKCLPISNIIRVPEAGEKLLSYVSTAQCFEIEDGTLDERLKKILQLCQ
ncbi:MAG: hypothetical protein JST89_16880 [Cyanobacteria bacterium SZAS-4]|nr:hypothetical protein [Cyanobacteria bacterium SZAS-4]